MKAFINKAAVLVFALMSAEFVFAAKTTNKATIAETEEWIEQHVQAWDDSKRIFVEAKNCKLQVYTKRQTLIVDMKGVLFPIEVVAYERDRSPRVRLRVKNRYSGDYGMVRECPNSSSAICKNSNEKWQPLSYYDFTITHVLEYFGRDEDLNDRKASSLKNALNHYANLCGAKAYEYSF